MHPSNGEAWKHFNSVHPYFSAQSSNVHLELCTNRFSPFGSFAAPLGMCMRSEFMFLSMVIVACQKISTASAGDFFVCSFCFGSLESPPSN